MCFRAAFAIALFAAGWAGAADASAVSMSPSLSVRVRGEVQAVCGLSNGAAGTREFRFSDPVSRDSNVATADSVSLPFSITCNTPMRIDMTSDHGGLHSAAHTSDQDFTSTLAYTAAFRLPDGSTALSCSSAAMSAAAGGCAGSVERAVTAGDGRIDVTLAPDGRLLLQGEYVDRVTVTVSPLMGGSSRS